MTTVHSQGSQVYNSHKNPFLISFRHSCARSSSLMTTHRSAGQILYRPSVVRTRIHRSDGGNPVASPIHSFPASAISSRNKTSPTRIDMRHLFFDRRPGNASRLPSSLYAVVIDHFTFQRLSLLIRCSTSSLLRWMFSLPAQIARAMSSGIRLLRTRSAVVLPPIAPILAMRLGSGTLPDGPRLSFNV